MQRLLAMSRLKCDHTEFANCDSPETRAIATQILVSALKPNLVKDEDRTRQTSRTCGK
ncbi:hypothetical protein Q2T42_31005 [Leptolyngbya boryana CZ1]|uniref:Uncharacterized protein n=1 Tax=Leptolyngbya boryana CZ1 TaxID=3060204 RepID=A0AA96WW81_LEPBY|nr:hypothetical protein [Leptolyngbya boryana]WNZ46218.1 hypothetical protein Q2T42_31005 [Leptolyngbya boryana CZ1]